MLVEKKLRDEDLKSFRYSLKDSEGKFCNIAHNYQIEEKIIDEVIKDIKNIRKKVDKIIKNCI